MQAIIIGLIFILSCSSFSFGMKGKQKKTSYVILSSGSEGDGETQAFVKESQKNISIDNPPSDPIQETLITDQRNPSSTEESSDDEEAYSEIVKDKTAKYRRNKSKIKRVRSRKGKEIEWGSDGSEEELEVVHAMTRLSEKDKEEIKEYVQTQTAPIPEPNTVTETIGEKIIGNALHAVAAVGIFVISWATVVALAKK